MKNSFCCFYKSEIGFIIIKWDKNGIKKCSIMKAALEDCHDSLPQSYIELFDNFFSYKKTQYKTRLDLKNKIIYINNIPLCFDNEPESHITIYFNLLKVPAGKTITYGNLALKAGFPGAARVCGTAMSQNPFPFIIPCHRVILSSGKTGNYGFGPDLKIKLLQNEGAL